MALYAITTTTSAILDLNQYRNHLTGVAGNTEAWFFRMSTGNDFTVRMSDNAAAQKATFQDSDGVEVWRADSDGKTSQTGSINVTSAAAGALTIGANGATNPVLRVDASAASVATGIKITGAAAASGADISVISSDAAENLAINAKGSGTITLGNVSSGSIIATRAFSANAGATVASGLTVSSGRAAVGGSILVTTELSVGGTITSSGPTNDLVGLSVSTTRTSSDTADSAALDINSAASVAGAITVDRASQLRVAGVTMTVTGTLNKHNAIYIGTPVNGTTVRVIDTASGGYLTTGGIWTNNPSWANIKRDITRAGTEVKEWLSFLATSYTPVWYKYKDEFDANGNLLRYERDSDNPHFGFLLDDLPASLIKAITSDASGGISTKDSEGVLFALVAALASDVKAVKAKIGIA